MKNEPSLTEGLTKLADLAMNQSAAQKELFAGEIYKKRYRNFFTLPVYWLVMGFFLFLGVHYKAKFSPIAWYVFIGMICFFLFISFLLWLSYAHVIIKSWRKK
jgi:hypothetical protein